METKKAFAVVERIKSDIKGLEISLAHMRNHRRKYTALDDYRLLRLLSQIKKAEEKVKYLKGLLDG